LWTLKQEQLKHILFPIGHLKKTEVRKLAKKFKLPVAEKKDSQGICFLGAVDLKDFLKHYIKEKRGKVLNEKGEEIGFHNGVVFHTLGERRGFVITKKSPTDEPYYVIEKDIKKNILYVAQNKNLSKSRSVASFQKYFYFELCNINWILGAPKEGKNYTAQIRYHGELFSCKLKYDKKKIQVIFEKPVMVAQGQSIVIYDKDICLGGGVVA
jgi:tRNA-uridine 2-sulfurtransferase